MPHIGSSSKVIWLSDVDKEKGYAVDFLSLSLHAVSRDPEAYTSPCIYTQVSSFLVLSLLPSSILMHFIMYFLGCINCFGSYESRKHKALCGSIMILLIASATQNVCLNLE